MTGMRALTAAILIALASPLLAADGPTRNAVFNGAFVEGVSAFGVLGPGYKQATLAADKSQHAQTLITELIVSAPGMDRSFTVYSTTLLQVRADREYPLRVKMAGVGHSASGAFEYEASGHHLGNNYSDRHVLTPELTDYTFTYKPSKNAVGIRPAIVFFEPTDGSKLDVRARVRSFEMPVPVSEFGEVVKNWPDYAKDDVFASYEGFTAAELKALQDLEKAQGILPPYGPIIQRRPGDFGLTTSRLQFGNSALPQHIAVMGQEILARPLELTVTFGDGKRPVPLGKATVRASKERVDFRQEYRAGNRKLSVSTALHYDALLLCTVDLAPAPGATVSEVALTLQLTSQVARYLSYDRPVAPDVPAEQGWIFGYGPIPQPGEKTETKAVVGSEHMGGAVRNDWQPAPPGPAGVIREWTRQIPSMMWVGDETRGLSLATVSTQGYVQPEGDVALRLVRRGQEVALTYRFITRKTALDKGRRLQFLLQVMPPKPVRADWLTGRYNPLIVGYPGIADEALAHLDERLKPGYQPPAGTVRDYLTFYDVNREQAVPAPWQPRPYRQYRDIGFLWYTLWAQGSRPAGQPVGGCSTPLVGHPDRLRKVMKVAQVVGHRGLPYFAGTHIAAEDPAGFYYVEKTDEWTVHPRVPRPPYLRPTCPESLFSAYIARGIGQLIDDYDIDGVYFDNCGAFLCQNTKHGCGTRDEQGALQPTLPILGFRKLFRMVRAEFVKRGKEPFIMTHAGMHPATISFTDIELQGEGTYGSDHTQMLSLGEWRARWLGQTQYGVQMTYLPAFGYGLGPNVDRGKQEIIGTPTLLAMALLHGTQVWNQYIDSPLLYRTWQVLDELDEPDVTFTPYWQWPSMNKPLNAQGVYATAYCGEDRVVLVLSNLSAEEREVTVPLAEIKAKSGPVTGVEDHMHGLPVQVEGVLIKCTIPPKNFRLLSATR